MHNYLMFLKTSMQKRLSQISKHSGNVALYKSRLNWNTLQLFFVYMKMKHFIAGSLSSVHFSISFQPILNYLWKYFPVRWARMHMWHMLQPACLSSPCSFHTSKVYLIYVNVKEFNWIYRFIFSTITFRVLLFRF